MADCDIELNSTPLVSGCPQDTAWLFGGNMIGGDGSGLYGRVTIADLRTCLDSCCDLQDTTDVGEISDNNIVLHPVGSPTSNTVTANMRSFVAGTGNTVTDDTNIAVGQNINVSTNRNSASGINLTISGDDNQVSGSGNTCEANESLIAGRNNTIQQSVSPYTYANTLLGISNESDEIARGSLAAGGACYVNNDFAIAIGHLAYGEVKGGVAIGDTVRTRTYGEVAIGGAVYGADGVEQAPGTAQTSFVTFSQPYVDGGSNKNLTVSVCRDGSGNYQAGCESFGFQYYEVEDIAVHRIRGSFEGITAAGNVCVFTIDTYFKNVAGTVTAGTLAFTQVVKDAAFTDMTGVALAFTIISGNINGLTVTYTNPGSNPVAKYSCACQIDKSKWY